MSCSFWTFDDDSGYGFTVTRNGDPVWTERGYKTQEEAKSAAFSFCKGIYVENYLWHKRFDPAWERLPVLQNLN